MGNQTDNVWVGCGSTGPQSHEMSGRDQHIPFLDSYQHGGKTGHG